MTHLEARVRRATPEDAPALAKARYEFRAGLEAPLEAEEDFLARCTDWMRGRLSGAGGWSCWVAVEDDRICGAVWLRLLEKVPNPVGEPESHAYVTNLFVEASRRGRGLGSALLSMALRECESRGVDAVILWPTPRSRSLYERHGFAVARDLLQLRRGKGFGGPSGGSANSSAL